MVPQRDLAQKTKLLAPAPPAGINALTYSVFKCFLSMFSSWGFWRKPHLIPFEGAVYAFLHQVPKDRRKIEYRKLVHESGRS